MVTERLRLEPVDVALADELRLVHQDPDVVTWSGGGWTRQEARDVAVEMARSWHDHGVGKWLAYDRGTGALIGRGGPSMTTALGGLHPEIG